MRATYPNPENGTLAELDEAMRCAPDWSTKKRCHALRLLLPGQFSKAEVAGIFFITRKTLNDWIRRWNTGGVDALKTVPGRGRKPKIPRDKVPRVIDLIHHPEQVGASCMTARLLHGILEKELRKKLGYSTVTHFLARNGFSLKVPRPWPKEQDEEARAEFRKQLAKFREDNAVEIWFADETGITGDPRPRRMWTPKGERPKSYYLGTHLRENIVGAVHPESGRFVSIVISGVDTTVFQVFLDIVDEETGGKPMVMVLDNAGWHKSKRLNWHNIKPFYLPPYSPDLNPIETLWLYLKEHYFRNWTAKNRDQLQERVVWAIRKLLQEPSTVTSITT